ncbi:MAG TPA: integration host factor, actinobacterial type [Actinomycetota bacterium]|nr:integration host factor, actinobacterial type [Actinomycetota bacterium]
MVPPPPRTEEQRREALAKAAESRRLRAGIMEELRSGRTTLAGLLARVDDETVGKMKVSDALQTMRGVGKIRAGRIMDRLGIAESRRLGGLGTRQIESLLNEFTD